MNLDPSGFRRHRRGAAVLVVAPHLEAAALAIGLLDPDGIEPAFAARGPTSGRGTNSVYALPGQTKRLHLRPFRHGGWLRKLTGDRLTSLKRPLAELVVSAHLAEAGAPVARPALVIGRRRAPGVWNAAVGTLHEESTRDGRAFIAAEPTPERVIAAADAAGSALRRLHDAGGCHADLHLGNLLLRECNGTPEVIFVDLDRARVVTAVCARRRMAEMMRLYRSLYKCGAEAVAAPGPVACFLDAYCRGDHSMKAALLAYLPRERARLAVHRLVYPRS
jgi:hypothetical protein